METKVAIRRGRRADAPGLVRLLVALARFEKLRPPAVAARRRIISDIFEKKRVELFVAAHDATLVGYALYFYTYSTFLAKPTLYLEDIFVLDDFRGSGIGSSLFMRCVREAAKKGCGRMEWSVLNWNSRAIRFYARMGARRLREWSVYRLERKSLKSLATAAGLREAP